MWAAKSAAVLAAAAATTTFTPHTRTLSDAKGDVSNSPVDLVRASLGRASNGELRGSLTTAAAFSPRALVVKDGIPGSVCLRLWTTTKPGGAPPDYLVCATTAKDRKTFDAAVLQERSGDTPVRVGRARASRSNSHNVTLRFGQSLVGRPKVIHFAAESTSPGCSRITCTDIAPEDGKTAAFRLRR